MRRKRFFSIVVIFALVFGIIETAQKPVEATAASAISSPSAAYFDGFSTGDYVCKAKVGNTFPVKELEPGFEPTEYKLLTEDLFTLYDLNITMDGISCEYSSITEGNFFICIQFSMNEKEYGGGYSMDEGESCFHLNASTIAASIGSDFAFTPECRIWVAYTYSAENYYALPLHIHNWKVAANDSHTKLKLFCDEASCEYYSDKAVSISFVEPDEPDFRYDGNPKEIRLDPDELTAWDELAESMGVPYTSAGLSAVKYEAMNDEGSWVPTDAAPVNTGRYRAKVSYSVHSGELYVPADTIRYEFYIVPIDIEDVDFTDPDVEGAENAPATVEVPQDSHYTGTVTWSPVPENGVFAYETSYTATVLLKEEENYRFSCDDLSAIEDKGWTRVEDTEELMFTKTFRTGEDPTPEPTPEPTPFLPAQSINKVEFPEIVPGETNMIKDSSPEEQYAGEIVWTEDSEGRYNAQLILWANEGYAFSGETIFPEGWKVQNESINNCALPAVVMTRSFDSAGSEAQEDKNTNAEAAGQDNQQNNSSAGTGSGTDDSDKKLSGAQLVRKAVKEFANASNGEEQEYLGNVFAVKYGEEVKKLVEDSTRSHTAADEFAPKLFLTENLSAHDVINSGDVLTDGKSAYIVGRCSTLSGNNVSGKATVDNASLSSNPYWQRTAATAVTEGEAGELIYVGPLNNKRHVTVVSKKIIGGMVYKVRYIAEGAFDGCDRLRYLTIGRYVKSIAQGAVRNCENLKKVTIGKRVEFIGDGAFAGNPKLKTVVNNSKKLKAENLGEDIFEGCAQSMMMYVRYGRVGSYTKLFPDCIVELNAAT